MELKDTLYVVTYLDGSNYRNGLCGLHADDYKTPLFVGEQGYLLYCVYANLSPMCDGFQAGVFADYLEDCVPSSEVRDAAISYYRKVQNDPNRNQHLVASLEEITR